MRLSLITWYRFFNLHSKFWNTTFNPLILLFLSLKMLLLSPFYSCKFFFIISLEYKKSIFQPYFSTQIFSLLYSAKYTVFLGTVQGVVDYFSILGCSLSKPEKKMIDVNEKETFSLTSGAHYWIVRVFFMWYTYANDNSKKKLCYLKTGALRSTMLCNFQCQFVMGWQQVKQIFNLS